MNITIVNFKGGVGKSMIAHQLISGFGFYGCEIDPYGSLSDRLPERVERIDIQQKHLEKPTDETIFDFGGFDDIKLDQAISYSDLIIIPFIPTLETIQGTVDTLVRVARMDKPILMVPNMSQKENDIKDAKFVFEETLGFEIEMFPIPMSVALQTAINENRSIV
ncbi:MAG: ParA family protein, partial [Sulfuricurvum sp.]|uniref:ParA family protein n=1 Tax=Sulfuricurvum sp. TaxID=2025608 RepID=UPI0026326DC7